MHWWFSCRIVPSHGKDSSSIPSWCNDRNVWISVMRTNSSHRTLPIYSINGVNDIKAPNKHIYGVRRIFYMNNSPYHGYCRWLIFHILELFVRDYLSINRGILEHKTWFILHSQKLLIPWSSGRDKVGHYKCKLSLEHQQRNTFILVVV